MIEERNITRGAAVLPLSSSASEIAFQDIDERGGALEGSMFAGLSERACSVGLRRRRFWNSMCWMAGEAGFQIKPIGTGVTRQVLNVGCGRDSDAYMLNLFFGGAKWGGLPTTTFVTGIDISESDIKESIKFNTSLRIKDGVLQAELAAYCRYVVGDAARLDLVPGLPAEFDTIFIRHQNICQNSALRKQQEMLAELNPRISVDSGDDAWEQIVKQSIKRLCVGGLFVFTSYTEAEHEFMVEALTGKPVKLLMSGCNPHGTPLTDESGVATDNYIAVACKTAGAERRRRRNLFR